MQNVLYYFIAVNLIGAVLCVYDKPGRLWAADRVC